MYVCMYVCIFPLLSIQLRSNATIDSTQLNIAIVVTETLYSVRLITNEKVHPKSVSCSDSESR